MRKIIRVTMIILVVLFGCLTGYFFLDKEDLKNYTTPSRVFVTGNIHGTIDMDKINEYNFPVQKELGEDDNLIIVGDFGLIWDENISDEMQLDNLAKKKFNILFVDGTHENFDLLYNDYEVVDLYGGKAHKIRDNVYHLMRGEIYTIGGKKYLVFGGGESSDIQGRTKGVDFWQEETPSEKEWSNLYKNLEDNNYYVDYVLTHTPPSSDLKIIGATIGKNLGKGNEINKKLEELKEKIKYKKWIHAYYHLDLEITRKHTNIFNKIIEMV